MKKIDYLSVFLIIALLIFNTVVVLKFKKIKKEFNNLKINVSAYKYENENLQKQVLQSVLATPEKWEENFNLRLEDDTIDIKSIVSNGNKLVLWFSTINCRTCIDAQFQIFQEYIGQIGSRNILLVTTSNSTRINSPNKLGSGTQFNLYSTSKNYDNGKMNLNVPCYFIDRKSVV